MCIAIRTIGRTQSQGMGIIWDFEGSRCEWQFMGKEIPEKGKFRLIKDQFITQCKKTMLDVVLLKPDILILLSCRFVNCFEKCILESPYPIQTDSVFAVKCALLKLCLLSMVQCCLIMTEYYASRITTLGICLQSYQTIH